MGERRAIAAELHVHPQTVSYRLTRLHELFGADLHDPRFAPGCYSLSPGTNGASASGSRGDEVPRARQTFPEANSGMTSVGPPPSTGAQEITSAITMRLDQVGSHRDAAADQLTKAGRATLPGKLSTRRTTPSLRPAENPRFLLAPDPVTGQRASPTHRPARNPGRSRCRPDPGPASTCALKV